MPEAAHKKKQARRNPLPDPHQGRDSRKLKKFYIAGNGRRPGLAIREPRRASASDDWLSQRPKRQEKE